MKRCYKCALIKVCELYGSRYWCCSDCFWAEVNRERPLKARMGEGLNG